MVMNEPISTKPYLIRALYEWCTDNGYTPYLAVSVDADTVVPREHVRNGEIVLNVSALATHRLQIGNDAVQFTARFSGQAQDLYVPIGQVTAIYAKETGHGMAFEVDKPLGYVDEDDEDGGAVEGLRSVDLGVRSDDQQDEGPEEPPPQRPAGGRPSLRRVK